MLPRILGFGVNNIYRVAECLPSISNHWPNGVNERAEDALDNSLLCMPALTEWPTELVFEVMNHLDELSLLELGATCKHLNALVTPFYSNRENVRISDSGELFLRNNTSAYYALRAVRLSFKASTITHLFFLAKPGISRFDSDMVELCQLMKQINQLQVFELDLGGVEAYAGGSGFERWMELEENQRNIPPEFGRARLVRRYADLADAVEATGCKNLSFLGGDMMCFSIMKLWNRRNGPEAEPQGQPEGPLAIASRLFKQILPQESVTDRDISVALAVRSRHSSRPSGFKSFTLNINLFWTSNFVLWTLEALTRSSTTLTTLHLNYEMGVLEETTGDFKMWTLALLGINLPALNDFALGPSIRIARHIPDAGFTSPIAYGDIMKFLYRHPTIKVLDLLEIAPPPNESPEGRFVSRKPLLLELQNLRTDALFAQWMIAEKRGDVSALHTLTLSLFPVYLDLFDTSIWGFFHSSQLHKTAQLVFEFMHCSMELETWLRSQLPLSESPLAHLVGLHRLGIRSMGRFATEIWSSDCGGHDSLRDVFHAWLNLFPNLEELEIKVGSEMVGTNVQGELDGQTIARIVGRLCPRVKRVILGAETIDVEGISD